MGSVHGGSTPVRFTATVVVGGTVSTITGGKFANGATTASFQFLFNEASGQMNRARRIKQPQAVERRWTVQMGASGSFAKILGLAGEGGFYVGINKAQEIAYGLYLTNSEIVGTSAGTEGGILLAWGDIYTEQLKGDSTGGYLGLDTPVIDLMYGFESLPGDTGVIHNLNISVGPEASGLMIFGAEANYNHTRTWRLNGH